MVQADCLKLKGFSLGANSTLIRGECTKMALLSGKQFFPTSALMTDVYIMEDLNHINSVDQNIQFTSNREHEGMIAFLDVEIIHNLDGSLSTRVHWKPTHMDQYFQFSSHYPFAHNGRWSQLYLEELSPITLLKN